MGLLPRRYCLANGSDPIGEVEFILTEVGRCGFRRHAWRPASCSCLPRPPSFTQFYFLRSPWTKKTTVKLPFLGPDVLLLPVQPQSELDTARSIGIEENSPKRGGFEKSVRPAKPMAVKRVEEVSLKLQVSALGEPKELAHA